MTQTKKKTVFTFHRGKTIIEIDKSTFWKFIIALMLFSIIMFGSSFAIKTKYFQFYKEKVKIPYEVK